MDSNPRQPTYWNRKYIGGNRRSGGAEKGRYGWFVKNAQIDNPRATSESKFSDYRRSRRCSLLRLAWPRTTADLEASRDWTAEKTLWTAREALYPVRDIYSALFHLSARLCEADDRTRFGERLSAIAVAPRLSTLHIVE